VSAASETVLASTDGGHVSTWALERAIRTARAKVDGLAAKTTLDTYGHLWPDRDESTRAAVDAVLADRADFLRTATSLR
jgi:hypothetical protein